MSKAEKTRQFIIEKTAPLFNTKGYAGTSLSDITDATGLTKGGIYGNFANKDEVALATFDYNVGCVVALIKKEMKVRSTIKEKLLVYVNIYQNFLKLPFPYGGCPILNTATEADDTHPALRKKAEKAVLDWEKSIVSLINKGRSNGEFSSESDPEQVAVSIIALIEGGIMVTKLTGKINYLRLATASVEKMINDLV